MVQGQLFGTGSRYGLKVLRQCGKRVKTKSQKVLGFNSYVCKSYRGKPKTQSSEIHMHLHKMKIQKCEFKFAVT